MQANLAPMEGVSDWPFRLWMGMVGGFEEATTPFLRITDTFPNETIPGSFAADHKSPVPYVLTPQLMASDPNRFVEVAHQLLDDFEFVELNCGCPSPKVFKHGAGSQLLADPESFGRFISHLTTKLGPQKLAVKIRLGLEQISEVFDIADVLKSENLKRLTVHGRTKIQRYRGSANWGLIEFLSRKLPFPVIGSGDVTSEQSWKRIQSSSINRVIIGRGALRNPWIFQNLNAEQIQNISAETIVVAMKCLYHLHLLSMTNFEMLKSLTDHDMHFDFNTDADLWSENLTTLERSQKKTDIENRFALGRVKLVWNYFRSSLPFSIAESAKVLRSRSYSDFIENIELLFRMERDFLEKPSLTYSQSYDWVYNGGRHEQRAQLT